MILKCFSNFALLELEPTIFLEVADIPQVASKWQSYIRKVSNEPESEKECQLLAALEEWEYAVYQSFSDPSLGSNNNKFLAVTGAQRNLWSLKAGGL